jgi:hypothetical protein
MSTHQLFLSVSEPVLDTNVNFPGIAFGKYADTSDCLDSAWKIRAPQIEPLSPVTVQHGGTGVSALPTGQILTGSGANGITAVARPVSNSRYLTQAPTGGSPYWTFLNLDDVGIVNGDWTPTITNGTVTWDSRSGIFIKIPLGSINMMIIYFNLNFKSGSSFSGQVNIGGLPYPLWGDAGGGGIFAPLGNDQKFAGFIGFAGDTHFGPRQTNVLGNLANVTGIANKSYRAHGSLIYLTSH